jgi:signal transduction histidine kinase
MVELSPESRPVAGEGFYLLYDHPYSFESDAWIRAGKRRTSPACIMNAGYSSGWCEESFGLDLVSVEVLCRARGDEACRFIMAPPSRIEGHVAGYRARRPGSNRAAPVVPDFFSRKRMEEELYRARDELEKRVEERTIELIRANERLKREIAERERAEARLLQTYKLEAIGRLAGGIAHDFNNLMAIVTVNCDLLRRRLPQGDGLRVFVEDIGAAGARAAALTQQLLAFSRAQPSSRAVIDLNAIVTDLGRMLDRLIGEDIVLVTKLADPIGAVEADRGQIEQVLMNLVVNARDAMPAGGTLTIETGDDALDEARAAEIGLPAGPYVTLVVRDTGSGMDEATLAHIFDPFFTTKATGQGTGLGLSTVYGIVKQSGGAVAVTSVLGEGSRFTIHLPRVAPSVRPPEPPDARAAVVTGSETLLVVEDQERLRDAIGVVLEGFGYDVLAAKDADDALRLAEQHPGPIHLLLTDVVMPRTSGPLLAERVREKRPGIKILFMSGYAADALPAHGGAAGPLLPKPFGPDDLARAIRAALG